MASGTAAQVDIYEVASQLWETADELRANSHLKAAEYSIPVLGLIFLKFADSRFTEAETALAGASTGRRTIGKADYQSRGVLYLPDQALEIRLPEAGFSLEGRCWEVGIALEGRLSVEASNNLEDRVIEVGVALERCSVEAGDERRPVLGARIALDVALSKRASPSKVAPSKLATSVAPSSGRGSRWNFALSKRASPVKIALSKWAPPTNVAPRKLALRSNGRPSRCGAAANSCSSLPDVTLFPATSIGPDAFWRRSAANLVRLFSSVVTDVTLRSRPTRGKRVSLPGGIRNPPGLWRPTRSPWRAPSHARGLKDRPRPGTTASGLLTEPWGDLWRRLPPQPEFVHNSAFGYCGDGAIELIEAVSMAPERVEKGFSAPRPRIQHVAYVVPSTEVVDLRSSLDERGLPQYLSTWLGEVETTLHDASAALGHDIEIHADNEGLHNFFAMVRGAAEGWDGSEPLRPVET